MNDKKVNNKIKNELIITSIIMLVFISYFYTVLIKDYEVVPKKVQSELTFKPVVAGAQKTISEPNDFKIALNGSLLTYQQKYKDQILSISQREVPDEIKDFPERYDQFINTILPESNVEVNGTTYYLSSDGVKQTAIAKKDNLLIFISVDGQMSDNQWVDFLSELKSI